MAECPYFEHLLVIPHLRVQNANAISSPLTHGFPSMTAFLGLMWALERKTMAHGLDLCFQAIGVVCHDHQEQITDGNFVNAFRLTRNPIDKDGSTAAIVEEGRIHLEISLIFALQSEALARKAPGNERLPEEMAAKVRDLLTQMRIAGGSVIPFRASSRRQQPYVVALTGTDEDRQKKFNRLRFHLLPGFALVARDDLLEQRHQALLAENPQTSRLEAWLSLSRINWHSLTTNDEETAAAKRVDWQHDRIKLGWVVPIPVGYGALSGPHEPGSVANTRDASTPFCFVESLYSIGQWLSPHRLQSPQQLLWYADNQPAQGLYRCRNDYRVPEIFNDDFD
ncbi:type I-F CRISPR-associated protein Csy2 [Betaproteobacteria bacterium]|nr:type I-F CRISPR-associated protein Csy2 [Betaproteobacteria bacterium]